MLQKTNPNNFLHSIFSKIKLLSLGTILFFVFTLKVTQLSLATEVTTSHHPHQAAPSSLSPIYPKASKVQTPMPNTMPTHQSHFYQYPTSPNWKNQPVKNPTLSPVASEEYQNPYYNYYYNQQYQTNQQQQPHHQQQYPTSNKNPYNYNYNNYNRGPKPKSVPKIQRRQENKEQESEGDSIDKFWNLLGPLVFPLPFLLGALPFALPVIPLALMTRLNDTFAEG